MSTNFCFTVGSDSAAITSSWTFLTNSGGVLPGIYRHCPSDTSNPGNQDSETVGMSGAKGTRVADVTASARTVPPLICDITDGSVATITLTRPDIRSVSAGPPPRYGTWVNSIPAVRLNNSPHKCWMVPTPGDA